jgi:uncharacterized membrane protein YdcZ (DUF606 family)
MSNVSPLMAIVIAALAGAGIAMQSGTNAVLGRYLGHPMWASFWQFAAGTVLMVAIMLVLRVPMPAFAATAATAPWWVWIGFITGSVFVVAGLSLAHSRSLWSCGPRRPPADGPARARRPDDHRRRGADPVAAVRTR